MNKIAFLTFTIVISHCLLGPVIYAQTTDGQAPRKVSGSVDPGRPSLKTDEEKLRYWQSLTEEQRQAFRERAQALGAEQLRVLREKQEEFDKLPPAEKRRIIINYRRFMRLSPDRKAEMEKRYQHFEQLPEEVKMEFRREEMENRRRAAIGDHPYLTRDEIIHEKNDDMIKRRELIRKIMEERRKNYEEIIKRNEELKRLQAERFNNREKMQGENLPQALVKPEDRNVAPVRAMGIVPEGAGLSDNGPSGDDKDNNKL